MAIVLVGPLLKSWCAEIYWNFRDTWKQLNWKRKKKMNYRRIGAIHCSANIQFASILEEVKEYSTIRYQIAESNIRHRSIHSQKIGRKLLTSFPNAFIVYIWSRPSMFVIQLKPILNASLWFDLTQYFYKSIQSRSCEIHQIVIGQSV